MIDAEDVSSEPNNDIWGEEDMNCAFMVSNFPSVAMAAVKTTKNNKTVILDPGSEISIFTAISLLKNLFEAAHPIKVKGFQQSVESSLNVHEQATFKDFGKVWYSADSGTNILSKSALVDAGVIVEYHPVPEDFFTVQPLILLTTAPNSASARTARNS